VIYLYAVVDGRPELGHVDGLCGSPVACHSVAGLTLALSRIDGRPEPTEESVLRHAAVVEALAGTGATVLPARFGHAFADERALEREVVERRAQLVDGLAHVDGCVELGLRVLAPPASTLPLEARTGADYMHARLAETTSRERVAAEVHDALAVHARDSRRSPAAREVVLSAAYLVADDAVAPFREELERLESSHPELSLLCTGPWPAYSFAGGVG
jgi:hypothetical protein